MRPHVARLSEVHPRLRKIHVVGEVHSGELVARGYTQSGAEWVKEIHRPQAGDADPFIREFKALRDLGYAFLEGDEWAAAELYRRFQDGGQLTDAAIFVTRPPVGAP
jgi:hypothetical protein